MPIEALTTVPSAEAPPPQQPVRPLTDAEEHARDFLVLTMERYRDYHDHKESRWMSGDTHLWIARRNLAGRGEGSSGLRYDVAEAS